MAKRSLPSACLFANSNQHGVHFAPGTKEGKKGETPQETVKRKARRGRKKVRRPHAGNRIAFSFRYVVPLADR